MFFFILAINLKIKFENHKCFCTLDLNAAQLFVLFYQDVPNVYSELDLDWCKVLFWGNDDLDINAFCFIYQVHVYLQARVSQDYHLEPEQWRIGISSILASALLLAPSKDTFWTTVRQTGNPLYPGISTLFFHQTESVIFYCIGKVFI